MLLAVMTWRPILKATESQLTFCGDALGVLIDAMKFRAREPMLNKLKAELALVVAPFGLELTTMQTWSMHNETCDWLRRAEMDVCVYQSSCRQPSGPVTDGQCGPY